MNGWQKDYRLLSALISCSLTALPQPVFARDRLYSVRMTVSESNSQVRIGRDELDCFSLALSFTAQVLVILKYFIRLHLQSQG